MDTETVSDSPLPDRPALSARAVFGIAVLAIFTILITWRARVLETTLQNEDQQPAMVGGNAPDFSAQSLDGRTFSLKDFRGQKNVVVTFWASWCGPCRLEMPTLIEFYKKNHGISSDFEVLAVSIDEDAKSAEDFASSMKLNFPVLVDSRQKIASAYQVDGIPTMYVIDKSGKIAYGHSGYEGLTMQFVLARELGIQLKN
jgi:peroxiredoxin